MQLARACAGMALFVSLATRCGHGVCTPSGPIRREHDERPLDSAQYIHWRLVAQSDLIVQGQIKVSLPSLRASLDSKNYRYETLSLLVQDTLKGQARTKTLQVKFYTKADTYSPSPKQIMALNGKQALAFLIQVDDSSVKALYFAGNTPYALQLHSASAAASIHREVVNQERIGRHFTNSPAAKPDSLHARVKALITAMLDARTETRAFEQLEAVGTAAVPSIIRLMDDRRPLPVQQISLINKSPQAFEAIRHYGPKVVEDALAAILEQITDESFGTIVNGGSGRERMRTVHGWRVYLHYQLAQRRAQRHKPAPKAK
jgi:hypothetical protein